MTPESIALAHSLGLHALTRNTMATRLRDMLAACPTVEFSGLESGGVYAYKTYHGYQQIAVGRITPSGTQAEVSINGSMATRIRASGFRDKFIKLSPELITLSDASHAEIVGSAHNMGLLIPPQVRREHPDLFVTVPERFAIPDHTDSLKKATAVDRLKDSLSESYFRRPCAVGVQQVDEWIEEAHHRIARGQNHANMLVGTNPDLLADIDRALAEQWNNIDFYRWLRPLVDVGGVFYIPPETEETTEAA